MKKDQAITFCLTSCGRFDLLRRTMQSFFAVNEHPIEKYILIDDSGLPDAQSQMEAIAEESPCQDNFQLLVNQERQGQMASIDRAYAEIETPYIFHCEDDWEFTKGGFLKPSLDLLKAFPDAVMIWLRDPLSAPGVTRSMKALLKPHRCLDVSESIPDYILNFNPGLRRLADYREAGSYQKLENESSVGRFYYETGRKNLLLFGAPYCVHIGGGQTMTNSDPRSGKARNKTGVPFVPRFLVRLFYSIHRRSLCVVAFIRLRRIGAPTPFRNLLRNLG